MNGELRRAGIVIKTALGFLIVLLAILATREVINEATAALLVLVLTVLWRGHVQAEGEARVRTTVMRELARNLDESLPTLIQLHIGFVDAVMGRLDREEPLYFAFSPDEDISLKIYGRLIPELEVELAADIMAYLDREKTVCDLLARLETTTFRSLSRDRQRQWVMQVNDIIADTINSGNRARQRLPGSPDAQGKTAR